MPNIVKDPEVIRNIISSLVLISALFFIRYLIVKVINSSKLKSIDDRRWWIVQIRNVSVIFFLIGVTVIWADELKTFALSLVAIAAAVVLAMKEVIQSFLGGILRASNRAFTIGDRIEIGMIRGDVIDHDLLTTTLREIGPGREIHQYTGRNVILPNSMFLTSPVANESMTNKYVLHILTVPVKPDRNLVKAEAALLEAAREECRLYLDDARTYLARMERRQGIEPPNVEPRVHFHFCDPEKIELIVRLAVPTFKRGRIEQAILRRYLAAMLQNEATPPAS